MESFPVFQGVILTSLLSKSKVVKLLCWLLKPKEKKEMIISRREKFQGKWYLELERERETEKRTEFTHHYKVICLSLTMQGHFII